MARGPGIVDWSSEEFSSLAETIIREVSQGNTVVSACELWCKDHPNRSPQSARFKFVTKLSKQYAKEYEWAKQEGAKVAMEHATQRHNIVRGTHTINASDDSESKRITQRQFLKLIRDNYTIVPDDYDELINHNERLRREAIEAKRELERVQRKLTLAEAKLTELQQENEKILDAFNIARRQFTGVSAPSNVKMTIDRNGMLQRVKVEE